jgi:hypothetical protein
MHLRNVILGILGVAAIAVARIPVTVDDLLKSVT